MEKAQAYKMVTSQGVAIPLVGVEVESVIKDTAIETTLTQKYQNCENETIEAIYTFPLPTGAQLMSLAVTLNGQRHQGKVVEAKGAEDRFEDAVTDGDSAMMLQQSGDSLYTLNLGNLQPADVASIEICYAQLLYWQQDQLRVMIPLTVGERYGQAGDMRLAPHQSPVTDPGVEHRLAFTVRVEGQLAQSAISSPSHAISLQLADGSLLIRAVDETVAMACDLVLLLKRPSMAVSAGYSDQDLNGCWVGWLSLNPHVDEVPKARTLIIVVDCSGSMAGVSMQQAKVAVREIVEQLRPEDHFNIVNFGSEHYSLFRGTKKATEANKGQAYQWIVNTDADLGGTEIAAALASVYKGADWEEGRLQADILLITDGQTYDVEGVLQKACGSGHRHFTVGVGSAVAEDLVRGLADKTDGACELVSPNENMAAAIVRHCRRSRLAPVTASHIEWPGEMIDQSPPEVTGVFSGDTLHLFARFKEQPVGEAVVSIKFGEQSWQQRVSFEAYSQPRQGKVLADMTLARLCASRRIDHLKVKQDKVEIAVQYQLQSTLTNYLVVAEREHRDESELGPGLRVVPQMLKANSRFDTAISGRFKGTPLELGNPQHRAKLYGTTPLMKRRDSPSPESQDYFDIPAFMRRSQDVDEPSDFIDLLNTHFGRTITEPFPVFPSTLRDLAELGVEQLVIDKLESLVLQGYNTKTLVTAWLYSFVVGRGGSDKLSRNARRAITKAYKKHCQGNELEDKILEVLEGLG